jgi:hypothetical protein
MQLHSIIPKLPAKDLSVTKSFYTAKLGFHQVGGDYPDYLMLSRDQIEIHFFLYPDLDALQNYGMCYIRVTDIERLYESMLKAEVTMPALGKLETKPWNQKEFSVIDVNHNLLTFGQAV